MIKKRRILFVVNVCWFFISHRLELARSCVASGWRVNLVTSGATASERELLKQNGIELIEVSMRRSGIGLADLRFLRELVRHFREENPNIVHLVTIKPVIFGGLAARLAKVSAVVFAISGLGYTFISTGLRSRIRRLPIIWLYKSALRHANSVVIFQNQDDRELFLRLGIAAEARSVIIKGSGVDTRRFKPLASAGGPPMVVLPARMLRDKGVREFAEAARVLLNKGHTAQFCLAGGVDLDNPAFISEGEIRRLEKDCGVTWLGHVDDMATLYAEASIVCLPSYREGLPKSLLEAASAGKPIITTDVPGCREVVTDGFNGLLVQKQSSRALADAIERLLLDHDLRLAMGRNGRRLAEENWDVRLIATQTQKLYESLL